jgi:nucleoside-diphosphate-sugar epimerase
MKIILGGATGTAGGQALKYCLNENRITRVVVLSRKSLTDEITNNAKVEVVLHDDFSQYPASILDKLRRSLRVVRETVATPDSFLHRTRR